MTSGKIFAIAEDRPQRRGNRADWRFSSDQVLVNAIAFERAVQPFCPLVIAVAVAKERLIFQASWLCHALDLDKTF
jgi:hypothetical protein